MPHDGSDVDQQFARVIDALAERFAGVHEREMVARVVDEARSQLEVEARVITYLPVWATRRATDRLARRALAQ